jgi:uncharacterized protein DUF6953
VTEGATSPREVAAWMVEELDRINFLYQETAVYQIKQRFGSEFTYTNLNGNLAIRRDVLKAFNTLGGDAVVWERGLRVWRKRREYDKPGRQQY